MTTLYLIPNLLGDSEMGNSLPQGVVDIVRKLKHFLVEDEKSARKFLKLCGVMPPFEGIVFYVLNEHTKSAEKSQIIAAIEGQESGILSDAGCPGIADPGSDIVKAAHQKGYTVKPLVGPSSILLALMASGFNGQQFRFHGYLPAKQADRINKLKQIEADAIKTSFSQIFIETPYRNDALLEDIIAHCKPSTQLCVATDLSLPSEFVWSAPIGQWKSKTKPALKGRPAVFLIWA